MFTSCRARYRKLVTERVVAYAAAAVLAVALALVITTAYQVSFSGLDDSCCLSEWLINYNGGFVRRGLGGAMILWITSVSGLSPRVIVFAILASCYAAFFGSLAVMVLRLREIGYLELLLAVSPFAALFPVAHHIAGQRKEVLMLALAGLAGVTRLGRLDSAWKYVGWSLVFAVLVAVHDGSVFFLPLFVIYLRVVAPQVYPMGYRGALLLVPAAGVFLLGYIRSSNVDITTICAAMDAAAKGDWCVAGIAKGSPYAVAWLKANALDGVQSVVTRYTSSVTALPLTLLGGAAGLIPVAIAMHADKPGLSRALRGLPRGKLFLLASGLSVALVFCVANDWNRWFYITTVLLTLMHFVIRYEALKGCE